MLIIKLEKMARKLKTLEEHNALAFSGTRIDYNEPRLNGIACPNCGEELLDTKPNETLASFPPQKNTRCPNKKCDYTGYDALVKESPLHLGL